jgi:hypothetical protein
MSTAGPAAIQAATTGAASPDSDGTPGTAGGGINRLNAFNGLFLRAEHLERMQDYARELALAVGAAGGPGVVTGFDVALGDGSTLLVEPGLAIDPTGRPLRSNHQITLSLTELKPGPNTFWHVRLTAKRWLYGNEAVQGLLCDEPCSDSSIGRPFGADGVEVQLVEATEPGLGVWSTQSKRSRLASRLFAAEAVEAEAWSRTPGDAGADFAGRRWRPLASPSGTPDGIDLAVLIPDADLNEWQVDVWAARRDRGDPPPMHGWQWRLGMRPWPVFVAQILQFQDVLGYLTEEGVTATVAAALRTLAADSRLTRKRIVEEIGLLGQKIETGQVGDRPRITLSGSSLPQLGVDELPPAGFLQYSDSLDGVQVEIEARFGGGAEVRVCTCRPVDVAQAVQQAQHRDRIGLDPNDPAHVDVLVPVTGDGSTLAFDWVAFVRRDEISCAAPAEELPGTEEVAVHLIDAFDNPDAFALARSQIEEGQIPAAAPDPVTLTYPVRAWAVPEGEEYDALYAELHRLGEREFVTVLAAAFVRTEGRQPLGALRATLLATLLGPDQMRPVPSLRTVVSGPERVEAIVVLIGNER